MRPPPVAAGVAGLALGVVFVRRQRKLAEPLLDLRLLTNRTFAAAMSGMTLSTMLTGATMLLVTQYFELVGGLSPVRAGLCMVPAAVTMAASALVSPPLARRIRPGYVIASGLVVAVGGLLLIGQAAGPRPRRRRLGPDHPRLWADGRPQRRHGHRRRPAGQSRRRGGTERDRQPARLRPWHRRPRRADQRGLPGPPRGAAPAPAAVAAASKASFAGAVAAAPALPARVAATLLSQARAAFTSGMHVAATTSAVLLVGVAVISVLLLRHVGRRRGGEPAP